jgi:DNA-binding NarL/FixJ family response regulator
VADDLQWCDVASLRWLVYLARRIDGLAVAMIASCRAPEPGEQHQVQSLAASANATVLRPAPLGLAATAALVGQRLEREPADAFARACHDATGGNPFLLGELLAGVRAARLAPEGANAGLLGELGGDRLRTAVLSRLAQLDPPAAQLARAVAVLGDGCDVRLAAELAGIDDDAALASVPPLIAAGVLANRQPLAFEHPLLRTAVYLDSPAPVRAAEHARAAELMALGHAEAEGVSHHLLLAGPVREAWAAVTLRESAHTALVRGAPEASAAYLRRALEEPLVPSVRADLVRALANALVRRGDPAAFAALEQALSLARDPAARVAIVQVSVDPLLAGGRSAEARALLTGALAEPSDPDVRVSLAAQLVVAELFEGAPAGPELAELHVLAPGFAAANPAHRYAAAVLALAGATRNGRAEPAIALARLALSGQAADAAAGRPLYIARVALALAGATDEALSGFESSLERSRARGSLMGQGIGLAWRALIHLLAGAVAEAENDGRAALAILSETEFSAPLAGAVAVVGWALIERGELDEADAILASAPPASGWGGASVACMRARLASARHAHGEALVELADVELQAERAGWRGSGMLAWRALAATAHLAMGNIDEARRLALDDLARARELGARGAAGMALRVLALTQAGDEAAATRRAAIEELRAVEVQLELARALVDDGAALRRAGERSRSREPLAEGMELAARCGATALVERARTELRAAGARPRSVSRSGVDALTPSERRVTELAASGLANAEIAQALFVTVRTVEMHLSAAYRKLGIASRAGLPAALAT